MPLRLRLKPHEKLVIGNSVIENGPKSTSFLVHSKTTILREKDILTEDDANTPAKRIYYLALLMYLAGTIEESKDLHPTFFELTKQFLEACPSQQVIEIISELGSRILDDDFYGALKNARALIKYEKKVLSQD
ncbi:MAG: flagellar biosynthesis repressor FlbT [Rhodospirillaceae bacterium]|nr:flagellar biosynthesis repressor FlbT [Rhodospirillaceae bacterium]